MKNSVLRESLWWKFKKNRTLFIIIISLVLLSELVTITADKNCHTRGCFQASREIQRRMNQSVNPCDDFYEFACGKFIEKTTIPKEKSVVNMFSIVKDKLDRQLKNIVTEKIADDEPRPFKMVKKLYRSCMNTDAIESRGLEPMLRILKQLGGWPVIDNKWDEIDFDWKDAMYASIQNGPSNNHLMTFAVQTNFTNSSIRSIKIDQASLGLNREFLIGGQANKHVKEYLKYMINIARLFGANKKQARRDLKQSLLFEIELAKLSLSKENRRDITMLSNKISIKEMQKKYPSIPWLEYINNMLPATVRVQEDEIIYNSVPSFITGLETLLAQTPKRTIANYLGWRAVKEKVSLLTAKVRTYQFQFGRKLLGIEARPPRWKQCVEVCTGLEIAVGAMYVRKYFNEKSKMQMLEMVHDIRKEFQHILNHVDWMDMATRQSALEKAAHITENIAYPSELLDDSKIEAFYTNLEINENEYFESRLNLSLFDYNFQCSRLYLPVNKTEWISNSRAAIVNAMYSASKNSISFPAGILQGTFFSSTRPRYMNYGAIGWVIGHEITHGFDDMGRQFDKDGNLVNWWAPATKDSFMQKAQCIIDQYNNFSLLPTLDLNVNGVLTQGENIADNGGIKEAYYAYKSWVARNKPEKMLPKLPYTPEQMFWISAANIWCAKFRKEALEIRVKTGYHSPNRFRVLGSFSNSKEFAKDFNCPLGSAMNPEHKCKVW